MPKAATGFRKLKDAYIVSVNPRAINSVVLKTADGRVFEIEAEAGPLGIPFMFLREVKKHA